MSSKQEIELFEDELEQPLQLKTGTEYIIKVKRRRGKIFARLFDETGMFVLRNIDYKGDGSFGEDISGTTDDQGILMHADVLLEDYPIKVAGEFETIVPAVLLHQKAPHDQIVEKYQVTEEIEPEEEEVPDELVHLGEDRKIPEVEFGPEEDYEEED